MAGQTEEESDDDSSDTRKLKGAKSAVSSGNRTCYSVARLGEKLYHKSPGFDLTDPNMHQVDNTYNCLHDVHLRKYFRKPKRRQRLIQDGYITADEKVLCTKKEYHRHARYTESVQLSWEKSYYEQQRKLLKDFLIMKGKGTIAPHIQISDMREWLVKKGTYMPKYMSQRQSGNTGAVRLAQLRWEVNRRLKLEAIEKEVCREMRMECKKLPRSQRTQMMKKSVECIPHPGSFGAGPRCLSSSMSGASVDLVFTSTSLEIFPTPDSFSALSFDDTVTPQSPSSDLLRSKSEEGRYTVLLPENERVIYETIKEQVITELRKNFFPVFMWGTDKREQRSFSRSLHPTSARSQQSHRGSYPPSSGLSSGNSMRVHPKCRASMHSNGVISPSTGGRMDSYLRATRLRNKSEEGRYTVLLPESERVMYETVKEQVITELRKNFVPVIKRTDKREQRSSSRSLYPTSSCSQQSHRGSFSPSSGPSRGNSMRVHPKCRASMSPSNGDCMESYLGTTFYTEVPISEMLCVENYSFSPGCVTLSNDSAASTVDKSEFGMDGLHATNSTSNDNRCVSVRPLTLTHKKRVKLLGGIPADTDDITAAELDLDADLYIEQIIKSAAQQLSVTSVNEMAFVNKTGEPGQNNEKLVDNCAAVLYHNICETSRHPTPYSSSRVTLTDSWCETTERHALTEFTDILSQSTVDLLKGTFGEKAAQSLKTPKSEFETITKPTSERLLFVSHANNMDTVVHKVAIEEVSAMEFKNTIPQLKDNLERVETPSSRPNTCASAQLPRQPSPTKDLLQAVVKKLVAKMTVRCLSVPEDSNETACKQLEDPRNSLEGPLSEFHYRVASRLCPALVSDIMESLVNPNDGDSAIQSPVPCSEGDLVSSSAASPHHCVEEDTCVKDGSNTDNVELSNSADILKMAVNDIESGMTDSGKQTCSHLPPKTEVVVDIITKLVSDMESGTDSPHPLMTDVAVDMVVSVLDNLSEVSSAASPSSLELEYTRPATAKIVGTVRRELEEQVGSTDALKQALNSGSENITKAISCAVSREVRAIMSQSVARHLASTSSSDSLSSSLDTTSLPVRPLTAANRPTLHPDLGLNPHHRSSSVMASKPVMMVVHFETVRDIVSRLLVQLLPKGLNDLNLADCSLFDVIFEEFSSNPFVEITGKKQKATLYLDSVDVTQVVLSVYTELVKLYDSPEHLQMKVFTNCPKLYGQISKLIVKAILRSPTKEPTAVEAKPISELNNGSSSAASSSVDNLRSAIDKEKTPKRKSRVGHIFLRIVKGVRRSFTSCISPGQVKD